MSELINLELSSESDSRTNSDRRCVSRISLSLPGQIQLANDARLACTVHDISESGIGVTHDPRLETKQAGNRLHVRCGDKVQLSFQLPGENRLVRARARVHRVWCRNGAVEMGLEVSQVNPAALQTLAEAVRAHGRRPEVDRRLRSMAPRELDRLLQVVADETFPHIAEQLETSAQELTGETSSIFFRALVQIEADKQNIARRFVRIARKRLMPDLDDDALPDAPRPLHFDQVELACAFSRACDFRDGDAPVREVVEQLVMAAGFRHLAPPLSTSSL